MLILIVNITSVKLTESYGVNLTSYSLFSTTVSKESMNVNVPEIFEENIDKSISFNKVELLVSLIFFSKIIMKLLLI